MDDVLSAKAQQGRCTYKTHSSCDSMYKTCCTSSSLTKSQHEGGEVGIPTTKELLGEGKDS